MQNWGRERHQDVAHVQFVPRVLSRERIQQKTWFFSKLGVFLLTSGDVIYHQPNAGDLGAILGASASIRGYIQQKQPDFRCVFYWLLVILPQMRGVWGAFLSVRAYALALWDHVSQWMRGTWGAVWVFAHAPRNPFKWLCRTWGAVWGFANAQSVYGSCDQMTSKTCKLGHAANLNNRFYCLCCSLIGYIVY